MSTSKRRRSACLAVYFAPAELEQVKAVAGAAGQAPSAWIRGEVLKVALRVRRQLRAQRSLPLERERDEP